MKNVLLLFTDQQRSDTIGVLGNSVIQTPALDSLAADSLLYAFAGMRAGSLVYDAGGLPKPQRLQRQCGWLPLYG